MTDSHTTANVIRLTDDGDDNNDSIYYMLPLFNALISESGLLHRRVRAAEGRGGQRLYNTILYYTMLYYA